MEISKLDKALYYTIVGKNNSRWLQAVNLTDADIDEISEYFCELVSDNTVSTDLLTEILQVIFDGGPAFWECELGSTIRSLAASNPCLSIDCAEALCTEFSYEILTNPAFDFWMLENPNFLYSLLPEIDYEIAAASLSEYPSIFKSAVVSNKKILLSFFRSHPSDLAAVKKVIKMCEV